jgi:hypothetical protein
MIFFNFTDTTGPNSMTIQMRDPEMQDSETLTFGTKFKTMMDGSIRSRRQTPAPIKLTLKWTELTRTKALELQQFLTVSAGQQILYSDFNDQNWSGKILTGPFEITTPSLGYGSGSTRKEANSVTLEFEGMPLI